MFGQSEWKSDVSKFLRQLEQQVADLQKQQTELRNQNLRLQQSLKSVARKLVLRLPLSLDSLEKGLQYDLIFSTELEAWMTMAREGIILDIRSAEEFEKSALPQAVNIPYDQLAKVLDRLSRTQPLLVVCDNGVKSVSACELLTSKGFHFLYVLKGGMSGLEVRQEAPEPVKHERLRPERQPIASA